MKVLALSLGLISCLLLFSIPASAGDLKIVTRQALGQGHTFTSTEYLSGSRRRSETSAGMDNIKGHHVAKIVLSGDTTNQSFTLDLDAHEYVAYETDKNGIRVGAKSSPAKYSGGTLDIWIESTDTGERQEMFGHTARHIITRERRVPGPNSHCTGSESETDGWYIDYSALPESRRPRPGRISFVAGGNCRDKIAVHSSGVELGFPMKVTTTLHRQTSGPDSKMLSTANTMEVIEFSDTPLDPALFEIPSDYRRVSELTNMNRVQKSY